MSDSATPNAGNGDAATANRPSDAGERLMAVLGDLNEGDEAAGGYVAPQVGGKKSDDDQRRKNLDAKARSNERARAIEDADREAEGDDDEDEEVDTDRLRDDEGEGEEDDEEEQDDIEDEDEDEDEEESDAKSREKPSTKRKEPTEDTPITIKVNGEEQTVTFGELKKGYSREADYTQKTMALNPLKDQYTNLINDLKTYLDASLEQEPDWAKMEVEDPIGYPIARMKWNDKLAQRETVAREQQRIAQEQQDQFNAKLNEHVEAEKAKLPKLIPQWANKAVAKQEIAVIKRFLKSEGFSDDEVRQLRDARAIKLIRMATLYAQIKRSGEKKMKPIRVRPPAVTPGTRNESRHVGKRARQNDARAKLKRTGSDRDAEAALGSLLGDD